MDVPTNELQMTKLMTAMDWSRKKLQPFREKRVDMLRSLITSHYGEHGSPLPVPVNMLELAVSIYLSHLVARNPRVLITTVLPQLKPQALQLQEGTNQAIQEMDLQVEFERTVFDALFSLGIFKVGTDPQGVIEILGTDNDAAGTYGGRIDLNDWVHDMSAKQYKSIAYAGHRHQMPWQIAMETDYFDKKAKNRLQQNYVTSQMNSEGDEGPQSLSQGSAADPDPYTERIELWDIWLPHDNKVVTVQEGNFQKGPLRVVDWDGPEGGPFHLLSFLDVADNIMPLAPAMLWEDMHHIVNAAYRKMDRQADRSKHIGGYMPGDRDDAEKIQSSSDGDFVGFDDPKSVVELKFGGVDQETMLFAVHCFDIFDRMGGNLSALGGLGPQSDTLGQDRLIQAGANKRISAMQARVTKLAKAITTHIAWYEWTDPIRVRHIQRKVEGTDLELSVPWTPDQRDGDFLRYQFNIVPYSMQEESPDQKLRTVMQLYQTIVAPNLQMLPTMGIRFDFQEFFRQVTKLSDTEDTFGHCFKTSDQMGEAQPKGSQEQPRQSPNTTRTNVRVNRPGMTPQGSNQALMQGLMGNAQPAVAQAVGRQVG